MYTNMFTYCKASDFCMHGNKIFRNCWLFICLYLQATEYKHSIDFNNNNVV